MICMDLRQLNKYKDKMKLEKLFVSILAAAALFVGCKETGEDSELPSLSVNPTEISVDKAGGSQSFTVKSNRDWTVKADADWLAVNPTYGSASKKDATVTVTALQNTGYDRTGTVTVSTEFDYKTITVTQPGDKGEDTTGGIASATVADFISKADVNTYYRLTGKVSAFKKGTNSSGKDWMQFNLTDNSGTILVYGFKDGEYDKWVGTIKDGGTVTLTGTYEYYSQKQQHEVMNTTIESFEEGEGPGEITAITVSEFISKADPNTYYRLTGIVSEFKKGTNSSGKDWMQFILTDNSGPILVYGFKDGEYEKWVGTIKDGGTVTLTGTYEYYSQKQQHEVMNTTIESFKEGENPGTGDTPSGSGTQADPFNAAAAYKWVADNLKSGEVSASDYYVKGKISSIKFTFSADYGTATFNISEDGSSTATQFVCYGVYYLENKSWVTGNSQIAVGDEVIVCGRLTNYQGTTYETQNKEAYLYSLNGKTKEDGSGQGGEEAKEVTVAQAIAAQKDELLKVGPALVIASSQAGFLMEQDGAMIYVYGSTAKVGDNVTVTATRGEYSGVPQLTNATAVTTNSTGNTVTHPTAKDITSTFDSYSSTTHEYVTFKGTLSISNDKYFNIAVEGATTLTGSIVKPNEDISALNGKVVTITGYYLYIASSKYLYVIATEIKDESGETPPGPGPGGDDYTSNVTWTLGTNAYDDVAATVNGVANVKTLKLGTSKAAGSATVVIPKGTKSVSFYGVSWKGNATSVVVQMGGSDIYTQALAANDGASGSGPYTMTVTESDHYTMTLPSQLTEDVTVTVTTAAGGKTRVILFGIKAQ